MCAGAKGLDAVSRLNPCGGPIPSSEALRRGNLAAGRPVKMAIGEYLSGVSEMGSLITTLKDDHSWNRNKISSCSNGRRARKQPDKSKTELCERT